MKKAETELRAAAAAFDEALTKAEGAGYHVVWPSRREDLPALNISETGKVSDEKPSPEKP